MRKLIPASSNDKAGTGSIRGMMEHRWGLKAGVFGEEWLKCLMRRSSPAERLSQAGQVASSASWRLQPFEQAPRRMATALPAAGR